MTVRYWAGARAAAGVAEETLAATSLGDLLTTIGARRELGRVLPACSLLVDGTPVRREHATLALGDGAVLDVLPPFAGG